MPREHNLIGLLSIGNVRYVLVRPHRGMRDGYEVINAWNGDQLREFDKFEEAIDHAHREVERSQSFDRVLAVCPEREEGDE